MIFKGLFQRKAIQFHSIPFRSIPFFNKWRGDFPSSPGVSHETEATGSNVQNGASTLDPSAILCWCPEGLAQHLELHFGWWDREKAQQRSVLLNCSRKEGMSSGFPCEPLGLQLTPYCLCWLHCCLQKVMTFHVSFSLVPKTASPSQQSLCEDVFTMKDDETLSK